MVDPFAEIVALLQPVATLSKMVSGAGRWRIRRSEGGQPFYCAVLDGSCRLATNGHEPIELVAKDFVLIPEVFDFTVSSLDSPELDDADTLPVALLDGGFRLGTQGVAPEVQLLVGHCTFGSPDTALLLPLLPDIVHVRGERRLTSLVELVREESRAQRAARDIVLARLLEVLFIEALRSTKTAELPGLLRGLSDARLAVAIRHIHESPNKPWTVAQLAKASALSRSAFFERFNRTMGIAPMEYLFRWRIALAKDLLQHTSDDIGKIAERVGYGSPSAFSVAFTRHVGKTPTQYAQEWRPGRNPSPRRSDQS